MLQARFVCLILAALCLWPGCDEGFDPNGPYSKRTVVYGVLTNRADVQIIRVYTTYPQGGHSSDTDIPDTEVRVTGDSVEHVFRDTMVAVAASDSVTVSRRVFVAYGFPLHENTVYRLQVSSPSLGVVSSVTRSMYNATLFILNEQVLSIPMSDSRLSVLVSLGANAPAYILRAYIEYEILRNGLWIRGEREIPSDIGTGRHGEQVFLYPRPIVRGGGELTDTPGRERVHFATSGYRSVVTEIRASAAGDSLRFLRANIVLTQIDDALYAYYNTVNRFPDGGSLRLDEPDYTNIVGGLGVFGATSETRRSVALPPNIVF